MTVTRETCVAAATEIREAITPILAKHGLELTRYPAKYGDAFKLTIEATSVNIDEATGVNLDSPEASAYLRFGSTYGLADGLLGGKFSHEGKTYTFIGIALKNRARPFIMRRDSDGREFKFPSSIGPRITPKEGA